MFIEGGLWNNVKCVFMKLMVDAVAAVPVSFFYNNIIAWHFNLPNIGYIGALAGIVAVNAVQFAFKATITIHE